MLSPRFVALLLAVTAVVSALPTEKPPEVGNSPINFPTFNFSEIFSRDFWNGFPFFNLNFFSPVNDWLASVPKINYGKEDFKVNIAVKNYSKDSIKVKIQNGFLSLQGSKKSDPEDSNVIATQFFYSYSLPPRASSSDVTAELSSDGWLTIFAPVTNDTKKEISREDRVVEIVETGKPYKESEEDLEDIDNSNSSTPKPPTELDNSETVTGPSSTKEREVTENNVIPNENDKYEI